MIRAAPLRRARPPAPSERRLHMAVAAYLRIALTPPVYWTSVDAGAGQLSKAAAGNAKGRGVKQGFPDVVVFVPRDGLTLVLAVELKSRIGKLSTAQVTTHLALRAAGVRCYVARSVEDVELTLLEHEVPLRARSLGLGRVA